MNHFLFPFAGSSDKSTALYGNIAIPALIRMMLDNGAKRSRIEAQIFGGAHNDDLSPRNLGQDNFKAARQILIRKGIRVVSEDVGGAMGRKVVFNTSTYEIGILKVARLRNSDWYPYDGAR